MPSTLRQLNVRLDSTASALWRELQPLVTSELGFEPSQAQVIGHALQALAEKYRAKAEASGRARTPNASRNRRGPGK